MSDNNNIYIVETKGHPGFTQFVSAPSSSTARAAVNRTIITVRRAKPSELLGVLPSEVFNAETGDMLDGSAIDGCDEPAQSNQELHFGDPEA